MRGADSSSVFLRSLTEVWGGMSGNIRIIAATAQTGGISLSDKSGIHELLPYLGLIYKRRRLSVHLSEIPPKDYKEDNLILLGGSMTNSVTKEVMETDEFKHKFKFFFEDRKLIRRDTAETLQAGISKNKMVNYGLMIKERSPFNTKRWIFILAGCRMVGSYLASVVLTSESSLNEIANRLNSSTFEIVCRQELLNSPGLNPIITFPYPPLLENFEVPRSDCLPIDFKKVYPESRSAEKTDTIFAAGVVFGGVLLIFAGVLTKSLYYVLVGAVMLILGIVHINWLRKCGK